MYTLAMMNLLDISWLFDSFKGLKCSVHNGTHGCLCTSYIDNEYK